MSITFGRNIEGVKCAKNQNQQPPLLKWCIIITLGIITTDITGGISYMIYYPYNSGYYYPSYGSYYPSYGYGAGYGGGSVFNLGMGSGLGIGTPIGGFGIGSFFNIGVG
ncbi:hypothetical protein WR25_25503 [Diploscapter pachys]|uniref:Uncharacterized protein n=1 Tax=Diploscapter pachys TaxID=2018661 RepID=A0A2A2LDT8_9BILA|nr:hypothetical protein WR25_25503 [Diploscapter pachys]